MFLKRPCRREYGSHFHIPAKSRPVTWTTCSKNIPSFLFSMKHLNTYRQSLIGMHTQSLITDSKVTEGFFALNIRRNSCSVGTLTYMNYWGQEKFAPKLRTASNGVEPRLRVGEWRKLGDEVKTWRARRWNLADVNTTHLLLSSGKFKRWKGIRHTFLPTVF